MIAQEQLVAKAQDLYREVDGLVELVREAIEEKTPIHVVEQNTLRRVLTIGARTLQLLLNLLGTGDVRPTCELPDGRVLKRLKDLRTRPYQSVFAEFEVERCVYATREGQKLEFVPLDTRLGLPESKFSFLLQDFDQNLAMEQPFGQVTSTIARILNVAQHVDSVERTNRKMGEQVEDFHASQQPPSAEEEAAIVVETADGKGIPIRRPADAPRIQDHQRRSGPKPDRKKMATVASVYTVDPFIRTPEEVVDSLFRDPRDKDQAEKSRRKRPRPCHRRMRASLNHTNSQGDSIHGRAAMFGWLSDEVASRNAGGTKPVVSIMDGEESLWRELEVFQEGVERVEILDLLHVTPRLWDAARMFCTSDAQAEQFVRERVTKVLHGDVQGVVRGLRQMASRRGMKGKARAKLERICGYLEKNRHRMHYDEYLAAGYPIASGVIEGACRHIVKDRMERTGMNWIIEGAQPMLDLRCVFLSEQWDEFMQFYITTQIKNTHPYRQMIDNLPWQIAV
jgi:hypothetical protein